jgi:hypothetical protein
MPDSGSWDVIFDTDSDQVILGVDFPVSRRPEAGLADLAIRIGPEYRFLQTRLPARPGQRLCGAAYVGSWLEDIRHGRHRVRAVLGYRASSVYAAAIAAGISQWQQAPEVILVNPQLVSRKLLGAEFRREIRAISPLLSDAEIGHARAVAAEICEASGSVGQAAAEVTETYRELSLVAYERVGLGGASGRKFTACFESYISWLAMADQIDPVPAWKPSATIISSDYAELQNREFPDGSQLLGRVLSFDTRYFDILRSNSVAAAVFDLLASRELVDSSIQNAARLPA